MIYERYTQERMAQVSSLSAQVLAGIDPKQAAQMLNKFINAIFPEVEQRKEATTKDMIKELQAFSQKDIILVQGANGLSLSIQDKKKG